MQAFSKQISRWCQKAETNMDDVVRYTAKEMSLRVVHKNPVDTGLLKNNWFGSVNELPTTSRTTANKSGNASKQSIRQAVKKLKVGDKYYFINNLIYAPIVEYGLYPKLVRYKTHERNLKKYGRIRSWNGFSTLAPAGMVRVTVNEFDNIVKQATRIINK